MGAVRLRIPAQAEYVALARAVLEGMAGVHPLPEETLADLKLALTEACTNAVRHSGADAVEIVLDLADDRVTVEVADDGRGFDPAKVERGDEGGLGLAVIRAVTDEVELGGEGGTRLRFVKRLRQ